jgi:hypothetical protein|tara:strand:- start:2707 stop:3255 length:549 start_codon:yes stop_codon:yes gene_type:complete
MAVKSVNVTTVTPKQLNSVLSDIMRKTDARSKKMAAAITHDVLEELYGSIIEDTPEGDFDGKHQGTLKGEWQVTPDAPATKQLNRPMPGRLRSSLQIPKSFKVLMKRSWFLTNNSDYINIVEFGGYPKGVERGTRNLNTGEYEIRTVDGFSRQAPEGMVRKNVARFREILVRKSIKHQQVQF